MATRFRIVLFTGLNGDAIKRREDDRVGSWFCFGS